MPERTEDESRYGLGISLQLAKETFMSIHLGSTREESYILLLERCIEATKLFNRRALVGGNLASNPRG